MPNLDSFTRGYIECALWASYDESNESGGDPMDQNYSLEDIAPGTLSQMITDCERFQSENEELLRIYYQTVRRTDDSPAMSYAGHDFWLSRNGHGAGFFDRDNVDKDTRDKLQDAVKRCGPVDLYIGDDGKIYA